MCHNFKKRGDLGFHFSYAQLLTCHSGKSAQNRATSDKELTVAVAVQPSGRSSITAV